MDPDLSLKIKYLESGHWWFECRRIMVEKVMNKYFNPSPSRLILDIGCGTGGMFPVIEKFGKVVGIDNYQKSVRWCREKGFNVLQRSLLTHNLPNRSFNICTAFDVLEHIEDDEKAMRQICSLLVPGGYFICTVPAFPQIWSTHDNINWHYRRYIKSVLKSKLENNGYRVIRMRYFFATLFPVSYIMAKLKIRKNNDNLMLPSKIMHKLINLIAKADILTSCYLPMPFGTSMICVAKKNENY